MSASIDLSKAWLSRQHGDILAIYSWINDERALYLIPSVRGRAPWFVVCESAAYLYDDPIYLAKMARKAADVLGLGDMAWFSLAKIIHEGLPDLVRMPSRQPPELMRGAIGSMQLRADGKVVVEQDVRLEREEGAVYGSV